jgi:ring-1,2-phenylacetyl-CoA epoxidase subunit PaaB
MALLNARDVFARRPECVSMWVVPAASIFSRTLQELLESGFPTLPDTGSAGSAAPASETYYISAKIRHAGTQTVIGTVEAHSPEEALNEAAARFSGKQSALMWWVFPAHQVWRSSPQDIESMYAPARDKTFRLSSDFKTVSVMRQLKSTGKPGPAGATQSEDHCER